MSSHVHTLCKPCRELDFDQIFTNRLFRSVSIGRWDEIQRSASSCGFCRLVFHSIDSRLPHGHPAPSTRIRLSRRRAWKCCVAYSALDGDKRAAHYTNKVDLKHEADRCKEEIKYRIIITYKNCAVPGEIQCLRDKSVGFGDGSCLGRMCEQRQMDFNLIASWYRRCRLHHRTFCEDATVPACYLPPEFRVIDLKERRIIRAPRDCKYATVSYRWGEHEMSTPMPKTRRENLCIDAFDREWIQLPQRVPRTIADAMNLTLRLGIRYFWNDSLCIIQDKAEDVDSQIASMDAVYSSAVVTIVAATSPHADYGLPGISLSRRYRQFSARVKNHELAVAFLRYHDLDCGERTIWNTRGWTLQEKIFSRRLIFITDHQVYFKCNNAVWSEDVFAETGQLPTSLRRHQNPFSWVAARNENVPFHYRFLDTLLNGSLNIHMKYPYLGQFPNYAAVVNNFTQRTLSLESDRIRAIQGVLGTLDIGPFYAGLPARYFKLALLWQPSFASTCVENQAGLPSWSWAGWKIRAGCVWKKYDMGNADQPKPSDIYAGATDYLQTPGDLHVVTARGYRRIERKEKTDEQPDFTPLASRYLQRQSMLLRFWT